MQRQGASHEALCLSYLAVASRRLGVWWEEDRVSFVKVTMAAGRIYAILGGLRQQTPLQILDPERVATIVSVPGDNHKLGVTMAADLLRLVVALRIATRPARILVCGQVDDDDFQYVGVSGADSAARDFETAAVEMDRLIGRGPAG